MTLSRSCVQFAARVAVCLSVSTLAPVVLAAGEEYRLTDPALEVVPVDSSPRESFLSMRADATGRLFVGGREAVASAGASGANAKVNASGGGEPPKPQLYTEVGSVWAISTAVPLGHTAGGHFRGFGV